MLNVKGPSHSFEGVPFRPVKFNLYGDTGEAFWVPYFHRDAGPSWSLVFEAKAGGRMDVFRDAKSGREALDRARRVIDELIPWDRAWSRDMELSDEDGWLVGAFAPTVRKPVAKLPSGRAVTAVGDTAMLFDPIAGQGANNGTKMARHLVESIVARADRPLDEAWMNDTFQRFWDDHGRAGYTFNNLLLEPLTDAGKELLIAQYGTDGTRGDARQAIANAFAANFTDPRRYTHLFVDEQAARRFIEEKTKTSWLRSAVRGRLAVGKGQLRQKLGLTPNHPLAPQGADATAALQTG